MDSKSVVGTFQVLSIEEAVLEKSSLLTGCELNLSCFTTDQEENQTEDKSTAEPKSRVGFERVPRRSV